MFFLIFLCVICDACADTSHIFIIHIRSVHMGAPCNNHVVLITIIIMCVRKQSVCIVSNYVCLYYRLAFPSTPRMKWESIDFTNNWKCWDFVNDRFLRNSASYKRSLFEYSVFQIINFFGHKKFVSLVNNDQSYKRSIR